MDMALILAASPLFAPFQLLWASLLRSHPAHSPYNSPTALALQGGAGRMPIVRDCQRDI